MAPMRTPCESASIDAQRIDLLQAHHAVGRDDHLLHQADQVGAAGQDFGLAPFGREQLQHLVLAPRRGIFEGFHLGIPRFQECPEPAWGSSASTGTRTPRALQTALEIAAPGLMTGGSPKPITPRARSLSGS